MSEKLSAEMVHSIVDHTFKIFSKVIEKYDGYVDKYEGDLIMALFGSKKASENDTERAIRSAIEMFDHLVQINKLLAEKDINLGMRIGINFGEVHTGKVGLEREGDFTVYGDAVNLASRMESHAPVNRIMVTEHCRELTSDEFLFEDHGIIHVKGKSKPVQTWLVNGVNPVKKERWERSQTVKSSAFIGRDTELKLLEKSLLKPAESEKPNVIGIHGGAGIGKSRLIHEFCQKHKHLLLSGYTFSFASPPDALWINLLRQYCHISEIDSKDDVKTKLHTQISYLKSIQKTKSHQSRLEKALPIFDHLLGVETGDIQISKLEGKTLQFETHISLKHFIDAVAVEAIQNGISFIIKLEDLQWIDQSSRDALKFILSSLDFEDEVRPSILFILLYRPEFDITKVMTELDDFIQLDIKPLKKKAVLKVMCSMLEGVKIPDKIASMIIDKSDGNPFYTEELTRKLVDDAIVQKINGQWIFQRDDVELSLPDTLNGLILSRIDGLEKSVRSTIQKGSVIGRDFLRKILKKVILKLDHKGPDEHLVVLGNYQLIFHDLEREHYWFKHMLTRDVAYNTLLKQNRKILHRVTAEVVEDNFPDESDEYSTFLAHHFGKAKIRDKQLVYCLKAMNFTQQKYDNESALKFGKQALDLMREIDNKNKNKICDLIGNIGIINMDLGKYKDAVKYFKEQVDLADEIGNSHFAGQAYGNMGTIYLHQGQFDKAEDSYEKLFLSTGQNKKQIAYAYGNIGIIKSMKGDLDTASDYHNRQLIACQELNDKIGIANALGNIGVVHFFRNDFDNAVDTWKDQSDILNEIGARKELTVPLGNLAEVQTLRGEFEIALTNYNRKVELCREIGDKRGIAITLGNIAENYFDQGNFEQSLDYCNRALKTSGKLGLSIEILKITLKKSDLLLANGEIENATQELRGIEDLMHKCNQPDLVFGYKRLYLELDFHQFEGDRQKQLDVLVSIDGLLTDSSDEQTANLNFLLGKLYEKLGSKETSFSYYRKALSKYNEIFKTSPKWLFQQNIELLTTKLTR